MAVVRLVLERVGLDDAAAEVDRLTPKVAKLDTTIGRLPGSTRPAAASISKLTVEEKGAGQAAAVAAPKVDKLGDEVAQAGRQAATAGAQIGKAGAEMRGLGAIAGSLAGKLQGVLAGFLGFQAVKGILMQAVDAISEAEATTALLGNRVVATGGMAERSAAQIEAASSRLSAALGVDDEAISQAADALLQFDRVSGDVFDRVTRTALDMSAGTKDAAGSAEFLGKVLQDVEEGLPLLNRQWRLFSDAQEAAVVKLARSGKTVEAQNAVLDAMETRVGGAAAAWRDTLPGAISAASVEWEEQLELLRSGLSPAIRQLAEDFVRWSQSAKGQEQIVQVGKELGEVIAKLGGLLRDLDTEQLGKVVGLALDLTSGLVSVVDLLDEIGRWTPGPLIFEPLIDGASRLKQEVQTAWETMQQLPQRLDPRALAGVGAGIVAGDSPGMTPAQRKAWDDAEAAANRDFERNRRAREDAAHRATEDAKRHAAAQESAREAAERMIAAIAEESERRKAGLSILQQEGRTREELAEAYREAEIAGKADAKVQEVRLAFLKAGKRLTDELAASIRANVIEAERAADATAKWLTATSKLPAILEALPTQGIVIPARISFEDFGKSGSTAPSVDVEAVIKWLSISEEADAANAQMWADWNAQQAESLDGLAESFRASLESPRDELEATIRAIDALAQAADAAGEPLLSAAEAERLRGQAAEQFYSSQIDQWTGFLSQLGDQLGGFFADVAAAARQVQGVNQTAQSLGGWSSAAGAWGGTIAAFVAAYSYADAIIQKHKGEKYGAGTGSISIAGGQTGISYLGNTQTSFGKQSLEAARAIQSVINAFEDALRLSVEDLSKIEVRLRNDGKSVQAWVKDQWIGTFSDVSSAIQAALAVALQDPSTNLRGISDLMAQGLASWTSPDAEGMMEFLGQLRAISDLSLSSAVVQLQRTLLELDRLRDSLNSLDQSTRAVMDAQQALTDAQLRAVQETTNALLGIDDAASRALQDLIGFQAGMPAAMATIRSSMEDQIAAAQRRLAELNKPPSQWGDGGGGGDKASGQGDAGGLPEQVARLFSGVVDAVDDEKTRLEKAIAEWTKQLNEVPEALSADQIDLGVFTALESLLRRSGRYSELISKYEQMRVDAQFQQLKLQLIAAGAWERWADIWQQLYNEAAAAAQNPPRPRGAGGGTNRQELRDDLRDEIGRLEAEAAGSVHTIIFDLNAGIADFTERAKEAKLPAEELARAIDLMREAAQKEIRQRAEGYAGIGTDFTARLREVMDFFRELRELGRKKTGMPDWKVDALEGKAMALLGQQLTQAIQQFSGLVDPMLAINIQAEELRQNIVAYGEAAGWTAEQIQAALDAVDAGVDFQRQQGINSVLDRLFAWMKQAGIQAEEAVEHERTKALLDVQLIEAQLRFYGALTAQAEGWIAGVRDYINGPNFGGGLADAVEDFTAKQSEWWARNFGGGDFWANVASKVKDAVQDWRQAVKEFADSQREMLTDEAVTGLTQAQQLEAARARMNQLVQQANAGDIDALRQLEAAQREFLAEYVESHGWVDPQAWAEAMMPAADLLANAQAIEQDVMAAALADALAANDNTDELTEAIYAGAQQVADAIYATIGSVPGYAAGGYVDHPHLAMVGERGPEIIMPVFPGWRSRRAADESGPDRRSGSARPTAESRRALGYHERTARSAEHQEKALRGIARSNRRMEEMEAAARRRRR